MNLLLSDPAFLSAAAISGGYDPDAAAYIARVEGASGDNQALETAVKDAINAFVVGCKADGIWSAIKASCILAGARTLSGALQPLTGPTPTNNGPFLSADYNRKTGLKGDGSSKYLDSGLDVATLPLNSNHLATRITEENTLGDRIFCGAISGAPTTLEMGAYFASGSIFGSRNNTTIADLSAPGASGFLRTFYGIARSSSSSYIRRYSGSNTTINILSANISSGNVAVFARAGGTAISNPRIAFYSIGEFLNLALLNARVDTLINAFAAAIP